MVVRHYYNLCQDREGTECDYCKVDLDEPDAMHMKCARYRKYIPAIYVNGFKQAYRCNQCKQEFRHGKRKF